MNSPLKMRYIALLRGINAGTLRRVDMGTLRQLFERLGYTQVSSYLNSGNILFEAGQNSEEIRRKVETSLSEELGFEIPTLIKSDLELRNIVNAIPTSWQNDSAQRTDVAFLFPEIDTEGVLADLPVRRDSIILWYVPGAVIWNLDRKNLNKSRLSNIISHPHYQLMTVRNLNTARYLAGVNQGMKYHE
jgi:uncharacterized protein (DUF1697 family)